MSELSADGHLARDTATTEYFLRWDDTALGAEQVARLGDQAQLIGRSALAQLASGVEQDYQRDIVQADGGIYVPVNLQHYSTLGERLTEVVSGLPTGKNDLLLHEGSLLPFGRILDKTEITPVDEVEVKKAIDKKLFFPGDSYTIRDDGSVLVPLADYEFVLNESFLVGHPDALLSVAKHGRSAARKYTAARETGADHQLDEFSIFGAQFSVGPYLVEVQNQLFDAEGEPIDAEQINSGRVFDPYRLTGTGTFIDPRDRLRQIEIVNRQDNLSLSDVRVALRLYRLNRPQAEPVFAQFSRLTPEERQRHHIYGNNPLELFSGEGSLDAIFGTMDEKRVSALALSHRGISAVDQTGVHDHEVFNISVALDRAAAERGIAIGFEQLGELTSGLTNAGERSRAVIAERLTPRDMQVLFERSDARMFIVRDFGPLAMTQEDHTILTGLARAGVHIGWEGESGFREFHRSGFWVWPNKIRELEDLSLTVAMFGGAEPEVGEAFAPQLVRFFDNLGGLFNDSGKVGLIHGNGPGIMYQTDVIGRSKGLFSIGHAIDAEALGQGGVYEGPHAVVGSKLEALFHRQSVLEHLSTIRIFNVGGTGTGMEHLMSQTAQKLFSGLPGPLIFVDERDVFKGLREFTRTVSDTTDIFVDGAVVKSKKGILGQPWLKNTVHRFKDYDEAFKKIKEFKEDPLAYWEDAGIPLDKIWSAAYPEQLRRSELTGIRIPPFFEKAIRELERRFG